MLSGCLPSYRHRSLDVRPTVLVKGSPTVRSGDAHRTKILMESGNTDEDGRDRIQPRPNIVRPSAMTNDAQQHLSIGKFQTLVEVTLHEAKSTVWAICADEAEPFTARTNELANCPDSDFADQGHAKDLLGNIVSYVADIQWHLECEEKGSDGPAEGMVQSVRIFRSNVDSILD